MEENKSVKTPTSSVSQRTFWIGAGVILCVAIILRFFDLGAKPFHHDESLHAYYSHQIASGGQPYEYQALLHGPFLYFFVGAWQFIADIWGGGMSDTVARIPAALFGVIAVALPLVVRPQLGNLVTLFLMGSICISPTFTYFSRFLREDAFVIVWSLGFVLLGARSLAERAKNPHHADLAFIAATILLAFHFVNKENAYLHSFLWMLGIVSMLLVSRIFHGENRLKFSQGIPSKQTILIAVCSFLMIYVLFYSSFFLHQRGWIAGVLDGLYRESLIYWWNQNQVRRVDGPFDYHIPIIANYEFFILPFLATAWISLLATVRKASNLSKPVRRAIPILWGFGGIILAGLAFLPRIALEQRACSYADIPCTTPLPSCSGTSTSSIACALHISDSQHVVIILAALFFGGTALLAAMWLKQNFKAFIWFWFVGALGTYSYVGEKVPWLTVYILIPLFLIAAPEAARIVSRPTHVTGRIITIFWLAIAVPFALFKTYRVNFTDPANPIERLVFTQTTDTFSIIRQRWKQARQATTTNTVRMAIQGDSTWPMAWYVLSFPQHTFLSGDMENDAQMKKIAEGTDVFDALFLDLDEQSYALEKLQNFRIYQIPLRSWWIPGHKPNLKQIFDYFFHRTLYPRTPESDPSDDGTGSTDILYLERMGAGSPFEKLPALEHEKIKRILPASDITD